MKSAHRGASATGVPGLVTGADALEQDRKPVDNDLDLVRMMQPADPLEVVAEELA